MRGKIPTTLWATCSTATFEAHQDTPRMNIPLLDGGSARICQGIGDRCTWETCLQLDDLQVAACGWEILEDQMLLNLKLLLNIENTVFVIAEVYIHLMYLDAHIQETRFWFWRDLWLCSFKMFQAFSYQDCLQFHSFNPQLFLAGAGEGKWSGWGGCWLGNRVSCRYDLPKGRWK